MKFGVKLVETVNITHFTHIVATVSRLCAKAANDKSCVMKLASDTVYFVLPEFASNNIGNGGMGRTSFWMSLEPKYLFEFYISEGKAPDKPDENFILLELQPETLLRTLKSSQNVKTLRIKLTKRQTPCLTVELDLHSMSSKNNSRLITHDIPVHVILTSKASMADFVEPSMSRTTLSIQLPPLKLLKHMIERMKSLSEFVWLEATSKGTLTLRVEADAVAVSSFFHNLTNYPVPDGAARRRVAEEARCKRTQHKRREDEDGDSDETTMAGVTEFERCTVRLSLKKLLDFLTALQFTPTKMLCNFVDMKYAHFFVVHDEDLVLQFLISSVFS